MSDGEPRRPRPQYGEYATPEEQRAAIKQPAEWQLESLQPDAAQQQHPAPASAPPPRFNWPQEESRPPQQPARAGFGDRLLTFVLLGFGLYNVISMIVNAVDGGAAMRESADVLGGGESQIVAGMPGWVWAAAAVAYALVWLVALFASLRAMRAGRVSFWIPLVAGIVATLLAVALMVIAAGENPQLFDNITPAPGTTPAPTSGTTGPDGTST